LAIYDVKKRTMRYLIYTAVILLLIIISFFLLAIDWVTTIVWLKLSRIIYLKKVQNTYRHNAKLLF